MELKKINRKSGEYKSEYIFFYVFYIIFSCVLFSISEVVVINEVISITLVAILYALVNSEIFGRANIGFYGYQAIGIPIIIIFVYTQYHINEFVK
ncbi:hypothetical protein MNBD_GAMMA16-2228 [hydrothermal vent metagenome]|uniref:Uncharacterized protein n=1 Tax=hydrothermal vent metagenome TaxID=652676 RepID=A0A3B0ZZX6_9ZZZZ